MLMDDADGAADSDGDLDFEGELQRIMDATRPGDDIEPLWRLCVDLPATIPRDRALNTLACVVRWRRGRLLTPRLRDGSTDDAALPHSLALSRSNQLRALLDAEPVEWSLGFQRGGMRPSRAGGASMPRDDGGAAPKPPGEGPPEPPPARGASRSRPSHRLGKEDRTTGNKLPTTDVELTLSASALSSM